MKGIAVYVAKPKHFTRVLQLMDQERTAWQIPVITRWSLRIDVSRHHQGKCLRASGDPSQLISHIHQRRNPFIFVCRVGWIRNLELEEPQEFTDPDDGVDGVAPILQTSSQIGFDGRPWRSNRGNHPEKQFGLINATIKVREPNRGHLHL